MFGQRDFKKRTCSYVLLEIENEKFDIVYPPLRLQENIVFCDYTTGKYNLILFVYGTDFHHIDEIIEQKISSLDGVLRIKECPVVKIFFRLQKLY